MIEKKDEVALSEQFTRRVEGLIGAEILNLLHGNGLVVAPASQGPELAEEVNRLRRLVSAEELGRSRAWSAIFAVLHGMAKEFMLNAPAQEVIAEANRRLVAELERGGR